MLDFGPKPKKNMGVTLLDSTLDATLEKKVRFYVDFS